MLKVLDLGANSGPHYIALTKDEKRLVISDYFLNEDEVGKVKAEGDHKVHVATVMDKDLKLDSRSILISIRISAPDQPDLMEWLSNDRINQGGVQRHLRYLIAVRRPLHWSGKLKADLRWRMTPVRMDFPVF